MLGIGIIPSVFLALGILAMPESPRWLIMQGRLRNAKRILNKTIQSFPSLFFSLSLLIYTRTHSCTNRHEIYIETLNQKMNPKDSKDEVDPISKRSQLGEGIWKELLLLPTPAVRHILITALGIHFFQQLSGIDYMVLYNPRIFKNARITSYNDKLLATVAVGFVKPLQSWWQHLKLIGSNVLRTQGCSMGVVVNRVTSRTRRVNPLKIWRSCLVNTTRGEKPMPCLTRLSKLIMVLVTTTRLKSIRNKRAMLNQWLMHFMMMINSFSSYISVICNCTYICLIFYYKLQDFFRATYFVCTRVRVLCTNYNWTL
ncbi:hypothetical protein DVH24_042318 [Malus domestica]|uniref:Major facilitator superfamily (MFS) profile domain-containing protein n=1 Tax=Malus domestica TaxID=3750 RepID=A0A498J122_MALDO|nr:hypothetical protein DVH24_042318 [Malus domestica]